MQYLDTSRQSDLAVEIHGLVARYGEKVVLSGVDMSAKRGEITVILGGSGCGKSTLLRHALGLLRPESGNIKLLGEDISEVNDTRLSQIRTKIGVLFQNGALFSSMTVGDNIAFVIRENMDFPEPLLRQLVRYKLSLVGLEDAVQKFPDELSGGMRKRAALARAIAIDPEILFCDEPSAGLDPVVASELDDLLLNLKKELGVTIVVVTHELESIKKIADSVLMLDAGRVLASGRLAEVMQSSDPTVRAFFNRVSRVQRSDVESLLALSTGGRK